MALSYSQYTADGSTREFDVVFPYLDRDHVTVTINNVETVLPPTWVSDSRIKLASVPTSGQLVEVRRETPLTSLVDYTNGATLTEEDLDTAYLHSLYIQQELKDKYDLYLGSTLKRLFDGEVIFETDPQAILDQLANLVLEDEILASFNQRISDIDLNAENIIAQAALISGVDTRLSVGEIDITDLETKRALLDTKVDDLRDDHTNLTATVDALAGGNPGTGIATLIQNEETARITADSAFASKFNLLGSLSADTFSFILDLNTTLVSPTESLSQRLSALSVEDAAARALIQTEETARITAVGAEASRIDGLITRTDAAEGSILTEAVARANGDQALAQTISLLGAENAEGDAFIMDLSTVEVGGDETFAERFTQIASSIASSDASILSEAAARTAADSALTVQINTALSQTDDNAAAIVSQNTTLSNAISAEATSRVQLASLVDDNSAAILAETSARTTAVSSVANSVSLLTTTVNTNTASILAESTARTNADSALTTTINGVIADVGSNSAAIVTETNARVSAVSSVASQVTVLSSTVGTNTSSIGTLSSVTDGLSARHGVSLNVNGHVTGFIQNNDGTSGDFTIVADKFAVVDPNGGTPFVPFEIVGGVTKIKEAVIGNLSVGNLTSGNLGATIGLDGDINVGTGRIVFDTGTIMKVIGIGFGVGNAFMEWTGPSKAISACDAASATQYIKTNGDAYFGGTLSAGILTNKAQGTASSSTASVEIGPFETLGGSKTVAVSYSYYQNYSISNAASWSGSAAATVVIERSYNGTSWTQVGTFTANGTVTGDDGFGSSEPGSIVIQNFGSATITDTSGASTTLRYRARLTSRTHPTINSTIIGGGTISQRIGIVSTEE